MSLLLRGGRVVDPSQGLDGAFDVLVEGGLVSAVGQDLDVPAGTEVIDADGQVVTPGLIDIHVHLREPGQEYKETVETGTRAAAAGGFTAVACMANTDPVNDSPSVTEHILSQAARAGFARVYPVAAISKGLKGKELTEMGQLCAAGAVAFSDDGLPVESPELMRRALSYARHFGVPLVQHAQDLDLSGDGAMHEGEWSTKIGMPAIPAAAEDVMVARDIELVALTGGRYHVQHLSSRRSLDLIREAKARGLAVTCEVSPHHLLLTDQAVYESGLDPGFKMNPPLRSTADREALVAGLADGSIDAIATDHAPHHPDEKLVPFGEAPFGVVGLETAVGLCLDRLVRAGVIGLPKLIDLLSCRAAVIMGLAGGTLAPGSPADITVLDLEAEWTVAADHFESKSRNTPFGGWSGKGAPVMTIVGGERTQL
ncbi:MAG: dihydroorotase [Acidobacteriota bacterium]|nr:dihydroorotase [Acidobacteriota bacterium]